MRLVAVLLVAALSGCFSSDTDTAKVPPTPDPADDATMTPTPSTGNTSTTEPTTTTTAPAPGPMKVTDHVGTILTFDSPDWIYTWEYKGLVSFEGEERLDFHGVMKKKDRNLLELEDWWFNRTTMNIDKWTRWGHGSVMAKCTEGGGILPMASRSYGCRMDVAGHRLDVDYELSPGPTREVLVDDTTYRTQNFTVTQTYEGESNTYHAGEYSQELGFWTQFYFVFHDEDMVYDLVKVEFPE